MTSVSENWPIVLQIIQQLLLLNHLDLTQLKDAKEYLWLRSFLSRSLSFGFTDCCQK